MHFFGIVLIPSDSDIETAVTAALEPYDEAQRESEYVIDRSRWWDWWRIGGRWDGQVRGITAPPTGCACPESIDCHYSSVHETHARNVVPVVELGECRPFTLVVPGLVSHREHWVPAAPDGENYDPDFPWSWQENPDHDRVTITALLAHRDMLAVGFDYHN